MAVHASILDIEARLGVDIPSTDEARLYAMIVDASALVDAYSVTSTPDELKKLVTCSAVVRAWRVGVNPVYRQETVGSVSVTRDTSELTGIFLNAHERSALLGSSSGRAASVPLDTVDIYSTLYEAG